MGRHKFQPTEKDRRIAIEIKLLGGTQADACRVIGISENVFRRHFKDDWDKATLQAGIRLIETAYKLAMGYKYTNADGKTVIKQPDRAMIMFLLKTQFGFKESHAIEVDTSLPAISFVELGQDGEPIKHDS